MNITHNITMLIITIITVIIMMRPAVQLMTILTRLVQQQYLKDNHIFMTIYELMDVM